MDNIVRIFHTVEIYGEFSNYYIAPFTDENGLTWQTVEHYYHAHKFQHIPSYFHLIRFADSPQKAYLLANFDVSNTILGNEPVYEGAAYTVNTEIMRHCHLRKREDWELIKISVMHDALSYKFTQHARLMWKLLATQDRKIEYVTPIDNFWGVGANGTGHNWIGYLLEKMRYDVLTYSRVTAAPMPRLETTATST